MDSSGGPQVCRTSEKDGIETLREILAIEPCARAITFSGREGAGEHNETAEILGAVASFGKPFGA